MKNYPAQIDNTKEKSDNNTQYEGWLTVSDAAELLNISTSTLRRLETNGKITSERKENGYRFFQKSDIEALKENLKREHDKTIKKPLQPYHIQPKANWQQNNTAINLVNNETKKEKLSVQLELPFDAEFIKKIKKALAPEYMLLLAVSLIGIYMLNSAHVFRDMNILSTNKDIKTTYYTKEGKLIEESNNILGVRDRLTSFVYNINIPTNIRNSLTVDGITTTTELAFQGISRIIGLQDIDTTTETTLERILDINGDVIGDGLNEVRIADKVIGVQHLTDALAYGGDWDFSGTWSIDGTEVTITGEQLNSLGENTDALISVAEVSESLIKLSESQVIAGGIAFGDGDKYIQDTTNFIWDDTNNRLGVGTSTPLYTVDINGDLNTTTLLLAGTEVTTTATELNYLTGATVQEGGIVFGDGTKLSQDLTGFYWKDSTNRLGIGTSNPQYNLDINGSTRITGNVILGGSSISLSGTSTIFEQTQNNGNLEFRTSTEGEIKLIAGSNALIALTPSNEKVYIEGDGLIIGEASHLFTADISSEIVQIGTNFYSNNLLNVAGNVGLGDYLFFGNTSGGVDLDASYGIRSNGGTMQVKNTSGIWNDIATAGGLSPSGTNGAVQFTDGTNFVSDQNNFSWNDTSNYLTLSGLRSIGTTNPLSITDHNGVGGITVESGGYIGIANTNPSYPLDVTGAISTSTELYIAGVGLGSTALSSGATRIGIDYGSLANAPSAANVQEALAALDSVVGVSAGDIQTVGSITNGVAFASIATADGQWLGLGSADGRIAFSTAPGNSQIQFLDARVGIGTTNAGSALDVNGEIRGTKFAFTNDTNNYFEYLTTDKVGIGTSGLTRLTVDGSGRVGIGTTNPDASLTIQPNSSTALNIKSYGSGAGQTGELRFYGTDGSYLGFKAPDSAPSNQIYILPPQDGLLNQVLTTDGSGNLTWQTASGVGTTANGDITGVGSMTNGDTFSSSSADGQWLGLGSNAGRLYFSDDTTDELSILNANFGIGKTNPTTALDVNGTVTSTAFTDGTATLTLGSISNLSNITMSGTLDLGTNTIYDGNLTGSWAFNSGNLSGINNLTLGGLLTISSPNTGTDNTVLILNGSNQVVTDEIDGRVWDSILTDGTGTSSYLTKWLDSNTLANSLVYESGSFVGIGNTNPTTALDVTGTIKGTSLTDGTATLTSGNATGLVNITANGNITFSGIGSTNTGDNVVVKATDGKLNTRSADSRIWGTTLTDGTGTSNFLSKWLDSNTLINSLVFDNGTNVGIGKTNPTVALDVNGAISASSTITGSSLTDGTATLTAGSLSSVSNITMSGTLDLGTNTIADGNLNGNWNFNGGSASSLSSVGTTALTASGTVTLSGVGSTAGGDRVLIIDTTGKVSYRGSADQRIWGTTLLDGSGTSNYLSRWLDANTLADGILFDNGTNIGLGNTNPAYKLDVTGDIYSSANIRANTEIFKGSIGLGATGSSNSTAGAYVIGTFDEFTYSNSANVQDVLDDLDNQLSLAVGSSLSGTGPANYIVKYSSTANTLEQSTIYDNGTNVGIGTTNPTTKLDVNGTIKGTSLTDGTATVTSGNATGLVNITASGTISFAGIGSTDTGDNIVVKAADGKLNIRALDPRAWLSNGTLTDGTGIANYLSRWLDSNTLTTGAIFDNGTSIGIGTTGLTSALNITPNTTAGIQLNPSSTNPSQLRFLDSDASLYAAFRAPNVLDENTVYTLPTNNGNSNEVLVSDGNGNLSWESVTGVGAGTGTITSVGSVTSGDAFSSIDTADGKWLGLGGADGRITFSTAPGNSQIQMLDARVGIGTTNASERLHVVGNALISGTGFITTLDLGTNTISDGNLFGNWNFNGGSVSSLASIGTTSLTASGTVTFSGIGSTDSGNNVIVKAADGKLDTRSADSRIWGTTLTDGTGVANYLSRWLDSNTLISSLIFDNGTNIGIGNTNTTYALDVTGDIYSSANIRANTEIFKGSIGLGATGSSNSTAGAYVIGTFDEFTYSNSANVQDVLDDLDNQLSLAVGSSLSGTGPANYIVKYSSTANTLEQSTIYDNGTNVGIGTTNPTTKLDVNGTIKGTSLTDGTATLTSGSLSGISNVTMSGTLDLGTNTIADGNLNGNWNFNGGSASSLSSIGTTALTASGTVTFSGIGSTNTGNDLVVRATDGKLDYRTIDGRVWDNSLTDGSGTSNYLTRWLDSNTLGTGLVYDNGSFVGIGKTNPSVALDVNGAISASSTITGSSLTDGTATLTSGSLSNVANVTMSGTLDLGTNTLADGNLNGNWNFNNGSISGLNNIGTTSVTASGTITGGTLSDGTVNISGGTIDLGTNTIADGNLNGNWNFNGGSASSLASVGTTALTASGTVTLSGVGSTAGGDRVLIIDSTGKVSYRGSTDQRIWDSTLTDGSGISNYLTKWLDGNTLGTGLVYDNGSFVGIGKTNPSVALDVNGAITASGTVTGASLTDGTATLTAGSLSNIVNVTMSGTLDLGTNTIADGNLSGNWNFNGGSASSLASVGTTSITATGTITFSGLGTGTDNTVLILNGSNQVTTDEIDARVWGTSLADGSGISNYLSRWLDADTLGTGLIYDNTTYVGIGTTNPQYKLDINGNVRVGTLASGSTDTVVTQNSGALETRTIDSRVWGSLLTDGTGTSNYITRWLDADTLGLGVIYDTGTNVGIGKTNPTVKLDVLGAITSSSTITGTSLTDGTATLTAGALSGVSNITMSGTLDLGTNTIADGNLNGNWNFNGGSASSLASVGTTALTASGTVTLSGVGSTAGGDRVLIIDSTGKVSYRGSTDQRIWDSTLTDGSGISNYLTKWLDSNTLQQGLVYDNGSFIGIGTTSSTAKLEVEIAGAENKIGLILDQNDSTNNPKVLQIENSGTGDAIYVDSGEFIVDSLGNLTTTGTTGITLNSSADLTIGTIGIRDTGSNPTTSGASLIGFYGTGNTYATGDDVQEAINQLDTQVASALSGVITAVGSMGSGDVFANATADNQWLGLGSTAGRIYFDDLATDKISVLDAYLGVGTSSPLNTVDILGNAVIGASYAGTNTAPASGLLVQGSLGLGTVSPLNKLDISGSAVIGSSYAGTVTAPTNGLLVQGSLGIGTTGITTGFEAFINGDIGFAQGGYINIGTTYGASGYGLRDNGGVIEAKDLGGNWVEIVGGGYWNLIGSSAPTATISLDQNYAYNLGIGTTAATERLHVIGNILSTGTGYFSGVDLGTNTITDGNFTGNWNFNGGSASSLSSIGTTALTASGTVTLSGIGSTNFGNNFLTVDGSGNIKYRSMSDGTGTSNYLARWLDADTLGTGVIYDNGTNVGIGTTNMSYKLNVAGTTMLQDNVFFAGGTTYYVSNTGNAVFNNIVASDISNPGLTVGNSSSGTIKLGSTTIKDAATSYLSLDTNTDTTDEVRVYDSGSLWSRTGSILSDVINGSTAVGFTLNTNNTLSTQGSKLLSVQNNGSEKMYLDANGNLYVSGTITAGNGASMLLTNKAGTEVSNRSLVIIDQTNNSSFTTTTSPYAKGGYGVVVGVGLGNTNDVDGDGVCDNNDICMVAYGGEVEVMITGGTGVSKGDYLFTSDTAAKAAFSNTQYDGLLGVVTNTASVASGYVKMIFQAQPQVTAVAAIDKTSKHNDYWLYADNYGLTGEGSNLDANMVARGIYFDTLEDTTKLDSTNTTVSVNTYDNRAGLVGGQTFTPSTTDNDGNILVGSTSVNDMYFYDRNVRDSKPEVQVELGIDPNWYNGVTLTTIDGTTNPAAVKNSNLSTTYNGSLVKVTGTYASSPSTIYMTIKTVGTGGSQPTFDWTDNNGNSSSNVVMTPGTSQALGSTGVSVTFTNTTYNVGDVFRIASWFVEPTSATRGSKQQFPERAYIVAIGTAGATGSIEIIDADTQKLWMRTNSTAWKDAGTSFTSISIQNGYIYAGQYASNGGIRKLDFVSDIDLFYWGTNGLYKSTGIINIANRNTVGTNLTALNTGLSTASSYINDIDAVVIPEDTTKEVTVSGWGYITGSAATNISESVILPYKFNSNPIVKISQAGGRTDSTNPNSLEDCTTSFNVTVALANSITQNSFNATIASTDGTNYTTAQRICYTWTATGTVSPKQFVAVATGAVNTDGGTTIINETEGTKADTFLGSLDATYNFWTEKVAFAGNTMYVSANSNNYTPAFTTIQRWANVHGVKTETTIAQYRSGYYPVTESTFSGWPQILGTASTTSQIKSLQVTKGTSTMEPNSNTIYIGTNNGVTVLQENSSYGTPGGAYDSNVEAKGSVKYYTKDYISEEMIGDIRGMWPLNGDNTASDFEDISYKANTLTGNNITSADTAPGVRGMAYDFNGTDEYLSCTDANCGGTSKTDIGTGNWSVGAWIKNTGTGTQAIINKGASGTNLSYILYLSSGIPTYRFYDTTGAAHMTATATTAVNDNIWHQVTGTYDGTTISIYVDGVLQGSSTSKSGTIQSDTSSSLSIGSRDASIYFTGLIDEPFITATALTSKQIKNMYETGYRALQSHSSTLGGGSTDGNNRLGFTGVGTSAIGAVSIDWNNQYMYVGINSTTAGGVSKIDLSSDTNVKTYTSSANVPAGGSTLIDEDVTSLAVGYKLEAVGSASQGIKTMGWDNLSTSTSGNLVSETVTVPESFSQAYLWAQYVTDSSDASNEIEVWSSNDGGSNYYQCNLTNTDNTTTPSEYEYFCQFNSEGSSLKTKFVMTRGSTKTNTYVKQYGVAWMDSNDAAAMAGSSAFYTNTGNVTDGNYLQIAHNQNTNDIIATAWLNTGTKWEQIDPSYKPAITWEGKDGQRINYYQKAEEYSAIGEALTSEESLINQGLLFDTFEDTTKLDTANTTISIDTQTKDTGTETQKGRIGLIGGATIGQGTTDTTGNTLLGSTAVNDMYFYDRSVRDSKPEVQVELGIDPNWYNGVTLTTLDSTTAPYSVRNSNLSTTYNGSLMKVTGTYTTNPRTIYVTIKTVGTGSSQPTFDWTDNNGNSSSNVVMTPGISQALGSTGVSVTFTNATYNVGDVFRIASWFVEPASATRGSKQQFPERAYLVMHTDGVDIIDADTQRLWMNFDQGVQYALFNTSYNPTSGEINNGKMYVGENNLGAMAYLDFTLDRYGYIASNGMYESQSSISQRNTSKSAYIVNANTNLINDSINDISIAVIPNQPTQEVTVSGWGYIVGDNTNKIEETVMLPYNFNNSPKVVVSYAGGLNGSAPNKLSECNAVGAGVDQTATGTSTINTNDFTSNLVKDNGGGTFASTSYYCYTWTATGTVSPKQYVGVSTSNGATIIDETNKTSIDYIRTGDTAISREIQLVDSPTAKLYIHEELNSTGSNVVHVYNSIATSDTQLNSSTDRISYAIWGNQGTSPVGTANTQDINTFQVTKGTSTINKDSNTIYIGSNIGVSVIQENNTFGTGGDNLNGNLYGASVKYYTNDYISEEMIGDIRGMWPLNGDNTASDFEDISYKANTLTGNNITSADTAPGVRGMAYDFNGTDEYLYLADDSDFESMADASWGAWVKTSDNAGVIIGKDDSSSRSWSLLSSGGALCYADQGGSAALATGPVINDNTWHFVTCTLDGGVALKVFIDGIEVASDTTSVPTTINNSTSRIMVGDRDTSAYPLAGIIDEPFFTANTLTSDQIKNMYETGYRALQSHSSTLGGGSTDGNNRLGFTGVGTSAIGAVSVDWNNQYMYVGINSTTAGGVSKIDLSSDTNVKTYTSSANVPAGGSTLIDEDVTSLAVGYKLEAVGSASQGIKTIGWDNLSTSTSGNYVSKTYTLAKNVSSLVLWANTVTDSSDSSNGITIKASNDGGSTYTTCAVINTDTNPTVPEKEYSCEFDTADNELKIKFEFTRGSTMTNTYVTQYGTSWLGESGFKLEQTDANTVRLYNYTGETRELRLDVIAWGSNGNSGGVSLAPLAADVDTKDNSSSIWINKTGTSGNLLKLQTSGTDVLTLSAAGTMTLKGDFLPSADDTYDLGSNTARWQDLYVGPSTIHIGTSTSDEYTIGYNTTTNTLGFNVNGSGNPEIVMDSEGKLGIGTQTPFSKLEVLGTGTGGGPAISGSTDPNVVSRIRTSSVALDTGTYSSGITWLQNRLYNDFTTNFAMVLNPNGGNIGIGTSNPTQALHVEGQGFFADNGASWDPGGSSGSGTRIGYSSSLDFGYVTANNTGVTIKNLILQPGNGLVGIVNTSPTVALDITGDIEYTGTITDVSDIRLKENFEDLGPSLDKLLTLDTLTFNMIGDDLSERTIGLSAQQVQEVFPEAVSTIDTEGHLGLDYTQLIPATIEAIKELNTKVELISAEGLEEISQQVTDTYTELQAFVDNLGLSSTPEGDLLIDNDMSVLGAATFNDVTITGELNIGSIELDSATNSIQIVGAECGLNATLCNTQSLNLQKNLAGNVNIFNGKIIMTNDGTINTQGTVVSKKVLTEEYSVKGTSQAIGNGVLVTGVHYVTVPTNIVKPNSKIFVTATNTTKGQTLYISEKVEGISFTVAIESPIDSDINFDWFIVNID